MILSAIENSISQKIKSVGVPLKDWNINIYRGILTGFNEAFIIDTNKKNQLIEEDSKSAEIIRPNKVIKQLKLTVQDVKNSYEILQPRFNDLFDAIKILTKNKSNFIILERIPALNYISYIKAAEYADKSAYVYFQFDDKQNNATYNCRKKFSLDELWKFIIDFKNDKMPNIDGFEIFD